MNEQLLICAKEIIVLCDSIIKENTSPNIDVIKIIKREFEIQYNSLNSKYKVVVLNKEKDLWASRTITDSAYFEFDQVLFDKVFQFAKLCKKLPLNQVIILY